MKAVFLDVLPGETVTIGDARITFQEKSGRRTRVRVDANDVVRHIKASGFDTPGAGAKPSPDASPATSPPMFRRFAPNTA
jgi:hypothetical protein